MACAARTPTRLSVLLLCFLAIEATRRLLDHASCQTAHFDESVLPKESCRVHKNVCIVDGVLVSYDGAFASNNIVHSTQGTHDNNAIHNLCGWWNFPSRGGTNSDALVGHGGCHYQHIRPASRMELLTLAQTSSSSSSSSSGAGRRSQGRIRHTADPIDPSLQAQQPHFSRCIMPLVLVTTWMFNFGEVLVTVPAWMDVLIRHKRMMDPSSALLLWSLPGGMEPMAFHRVLLAPYSRLPVMGVDEMGGGGAAVGLPSCFERLVACQLSGYGHGQPPDVHTGVLVQHVGSRGQLPPDPLGFGPPVPPGAKHWEDTTLRVAIEVRQGATRTIRNLHAVLQACEEADRKGFTAGSFRRLSCRPLSTSDTPQLHGVARFHASMAAARSAHVLVALHGAGAANSFFMHTEAYSSALLEVRPCGFGTEYGWWPDAYMASLHAWAGNKIRFFAYNVEDPAQCSPPDYKVSYDADPQHVRIHADAALTCRDQHVTLNPRQFVEALRHVGSLLRDTRAHAASTAARQLHVYALPGGRLALGPLGLTTLTTLTQHPAAPGNTVLTA